MGDAVMLVGFSIFEFLWFDRFTSAGFILGPFIAGPTDWNLFGSSSFLLDFVINFDCKSFAGARGCYKGFA